MPDIPERRPVADLLDLPNPCDVAWEEMRGDGPVRFCGRCRHDVHDLSALTAAEARALVESDGPTVCVSFLVDDEGNMLTRAPGREGKVRLRTLSDAHRPPSGPSARTRSTLASLAGGLAGAALVAGCSSASDRSPPSSIAAVEPSSAVAGGPVPAPLATASAEPAPAAPVPTMAPGASAPVSVASSPPATTSPAPSASVAACVHKPHRTGGLPMRIKR
jgi:hypothetical protein